jgi:lysozyme family protein
MADAKTAIEFVLRQEDSTLSGVVTDDAGGRTRFGIAERWHPELTSRGFFDGMAAADAQAIAEGLYESGYWVPINGAAVNSQDFANRYLSFGINLGIHQAVKLAQESLVALGARIGVDGDPGPSTISALNAQLGANEAALMAGWRNQLTAFYRRVVAANPAQEEYLAGWLNRVKA